MVLVAILFIEINPAALLFDALKRNMNHRAISVAKNWSIIKVAINRLFIILAIHILSWFHIMRILQGENEGLRISFRLSY